MSQARPPLHHTPRWATTLLRRQGRGVEVSRRMACPAHRSDARAGKGRSRKPLLYSGFGAPAGKSRPLLGNGFGAPAGKARRGPPSLTWIWHVREEGNGTPTLPRQRVRRPELAREARQMPPPRRESGADPPPSRRHDWRTEEAREARRMAPPPARIWHVAGEPRVTGLTVAARRRVHLAGSSGHRMTAAAERRR